MRIAIIYIGPPQVSLAFYILALHIVLYCAPMDELGFLYGVMRFPQRHFWHTQISNPMMRHRLLQSRYGRHNSTNVGHVFHGYVLNIAELSINGILHPKKRD